METNKKTWLSERDVAHSLRQSHLRQKGPKAWSQVAAYVRRADRDPAWRTEGTAMAWELGLSEILRFETAIRLIYGVTIQVCEPAGPKEPPQKPVVPLTLAEMQDRGNYEGSAAKTNGGISGFHPLLTEEQETRGARPIMGVNAFSTVTAVGGIPELAWYWSASVFELGISSVLVASEKNPTCGAPTGPNAHQTDAATLQKLIRSALRQLTPRQRTVLEIAYEDRRIDTKLVSKYGHGIAPLIARGRDAKARFVEGLAGEATKGITDGLAAMMGVRKRARTDWEPLPEHEARRLLSEAHERYREARGMTAKRKRSPKSRKPRYEPALLISVPVGNGKRKLFEAA